MSKVGLIGTLRGDNLARRVLIQNYPIRPDQRDSRALFSMEFAAPFRPGSYHNFDKPSISTGERAETTEREEAKASEQASPFLSEDFDAPQSRGLRVRFQSSICEAFDHRSSSESRLPYLIPLRDLVGDR
jgi:hypothetical protein